MHLNAWRQLWTECYPPVTSVQSRSLGEMSEDAYDRAWQTFRGLRRPAPHRDDWGAWAGGHAFHLLMLVAIDSEEARGCFPPLDPIARFTLRR